MFSPKVKKQTKGMICYVKRRVKSQCTSIDFTCKVFVMNRNDGFSVTI